MRIAYLILTHSMPDHLGRLISALRDGEARFYVHVDRRVADEPFLAHRAVDVEFLERRVSVYWGQWQMVEATLGLMALALDHADPDYLVLLSGTDYPFRSPRRIQTLLGDGSGDGVFLNSVPMPNEALAKPISRLERYRFRSDRSRFDNYRRALPTMVRGPHPGPRFSRRWFFTRDWRRDLGMDPFGGSSWWALPADAARYVLAFAEREGRVVRFFEHTRNPDESFFQTVLANSAFASRIRRNLTYADWTAGGSHPAWITPAHVERFAEPGPFIEGGPYGRGELCFARKFRDDDGFMTELVDAAVRTNEGSLATAG
jgi:core-2/I-Branching enzyme